MISLLGSWGKPEETKSNFRRHLLLNPGVEKLLKECNQKGLMGGNTRHHKLSRKGLYLASLHALIEGRGLESQTSWEGEKLTEWKKISASSHFPICRCGRAGRKRGSETVGAEQNAQKRHRETGKKIKGRGVLGKRNFVPGAGSDVKGIGLIIVGRGGKNDKYR